MTTWLVLAALATVTASGLPGLVMARGSRRAMRISTVALVAGCTVGLVGAVLALAGAESAPVTAEWTLPIGRFAVAIDPLSAVFLILIFTVSAASAIYGERYWPATEHPRTSARMRAYFGVCVGSLGLLVTATDGILFLVGWELMALSCFFLVTTDDDNADARAAGWLYLVFTHLAVIALMAFFALMHDATGTFDLARLSDSVPASTRNALFVLALFAFGLKAGVIPLHPWLPAAHANAPSHVSALMSGVMIKMGIYGLVRFLGLLPNPPPYWGGLLLVLGVVSGVVGVLYALGQHDLKRLLAYHSIENIGIILMGIGLALLGRSLGEPSWVALGLGGALLHTWNHGLFKSLLFLGAGSVIHATGTRAIDQMGGLARRMPWTGALFLIGALAICGLPPLNGFVSELLVYLGLGDTITGAASPHAPGAALVLPALALVGALALACFVKVYGAVFLGEPRSERARTSHEAPPSMLLPMGLLAGLCVAIGLLPVLMAPALDRAIAGWPGIAAPPPLAAAAPLTSATVAALGLAVALGVAIALLRRRVARSPLGTVGTWDCGYARPTASMQYTASSFAQTLLHIFGWVLRPKVHRPALEGAFPRAASYSSHLGEPVLERTVALFGRGSRVLRRLHVLQQGRSQLYILYILLAVLALLIWLLPFDGILADWFAQGVNP